MSEIITAAITGCVTLLGGAFEQPGGPSGNG